MGDLGGLLLNEFLVDDGIGEFFDGFVFEVCGVGYDVCFFGDGLGDIGRVLRNEVGPEGKAEGEQVEKRGEEEGDCDDEAVGFVERTAGGEVVS